MVFIGLSKFDVLNHLGKPCRLKRGYIETLNKSWNSVSSVGVVSEWILIEPVSFKVSTSLNTISCSSRDSRRGRLPPPPRSFVKTQKKAGVGAFGDAPRPAVAERGRCGSQSKEEESNNERKVEIGGSGDGSPRNRVESAVEAAVGVVVAAVVVGGFVAARGGRVRPAEDLVPAAVRGVTAERPATQGRFARH